ncbi:MAG: GntR family transcriptional regulator [Anaerolineaceae bacterium]|nr:GntR family transcriptional regulator [Anaerolineaceae bacterium]
MSKFTISRDSSLPIHVQLLHELRQKILHGELKPHDKLPGEWELAKALEISRSTIRQAWHFAQEEGLLYRNPGKGTFVAESPSKSTTQRYTVGFVIPRYCERFTMKLLGSAETALRQRGLSVRFATTSSIDEENYLLDQFSKDGVSGIIIVAAHGKKQDRILLSNKLNIPVMLLDRPLKGGILPCVSSNNYEGGLQAMRHLIELGHRKILFVVSPYMDLWSVSERYRAYQDTLLLQGIEPEPPFLIGCGETMHLPEDEETRPLVERLKSGDIPTAIFAENDWIALKVLRAIQSAGLNIPDDISVVGFDNLDIAQYPKPPLTTIAQDIDLMGAEAARYMIALIEEKIIPEPLTLLPTRLVVRESTRSIA